MASWVESLVRECDKEDQRALAGVCPKCGLVEYVVLFREDGKARVKCRVCGTHCTISAGS